MNLLIIGIYTRIGHEKDVSIGVGSHFSYCASLVFNSKWKSLSDPKMVCLLGFILDICEWGSKNWLIFCVKLLWFSVVLKLDLHVAAVDFVDDLEMSGQQGLEEVDRPAFQSLRQHSVVGVGAGPNTDVPCLRRARKSTQLQLVRYTSFISNLCNTFKLMPAIHKRKKNTFYCN